MLSAVAQAVSPKLAAETANRHCLLSNLRHCTDGFEVLRFG